MDELVQACVTLVNNSGGSLLYADLLAATPQEMRSALPKALKQARASNLLTQSVKNVDGKTVHTIHKV